MTSPMIKMTLSLLLAASLGTLGGCSTVSRADFDALKAQVDRTAADVAAARSAADSAAAAASRAQSTADAAQSAAAAAKAAADAANACCTDTQSKLDRIFKKSMYK